MTTLARLRKAAPEGTVINDTREWGVHQCDVDAPPGMIWKATGNHSFTDNAYAPWKPDYADLIARVRMGVEPCTDPNCEWCAETREEQKTCQTTI